MKLKDSMSYEKKSNLLLCLFSNKLNGQDFGLTTYWQIFVRQNMWQICGKSDTAAAKKNGKNFLGFRKFK